MAARLLLQYALAGPPLLRQNMVGTFNRLDDCCRVVTFAPARDHSRETAQLAPSTPPRSELGHCLIRLL